jgi:MSHA pilin protein MshC
MRLQSGFTLIEVIAVMVLVGVLAAVGASRFFDAAGFRASGLASEMAAAVRYGQKIAFASRCRVQVTINGNVGGTDFLYALHYVDEPARSVPLDCTDGPLVDVPRPPPQAAAAYAAPSAAGVEVVGAAQFVFDDEGVPRGLAAPAVVQIGGRRLTVEPGSGLVYVR